MKRSEMIKNMVMFFSDHKDKLGYGWSIDDFMDNLLTDMEIDGMLPPNNGKKKAIKKSSAPCVINALNCHQWEPEDE